MSRVESGSCILGSMTTSVPSLGDIYVCESTSGLECFSSPDPSVLPLQGLGLGAVGVGMLQRMYLPAKGSLWLAAEVTSNVKEQPMLIPN